MNAFKQRCIELRKQDLTLAEIVAKTGRSKTSVYAHIKNIPLSSRKRGEIRWATVQRALLNSAARKGRSTRAFTAFSRWNSYTVLLVSHLLFDGEIGRNRCVYNNRNRALVDRFVQLMRRLYVYDPIRYRNPATTVLRVSYNNVALAAFLQERRGYLVEHVVSMPKKLQREFLRAFFDDEGCMDVRFERNVRRIRGYQKDRNILKIVQKILANFGIVADLHGENEVVISGKENLKKFQKELDFSKGVRINGRRTNSVWKKSLEKRELLRRAIASFKT